jgi:hypothetical protein
LLSIPGGSYLDVDQLYLSAGAGLVATGTLDALVEVGLTGGVFSLNLSESDGFLSTILPAEGLKAHFDLAIGWTRSQGVYFRGSSALEVRLPTHCNLGPISVDNLYLTIHPD